MHCIALYCIALRCVALHCIALRCVALHCVALRCIALHCICIALHCHPSHHITSQSQITFYTLHDVALHYIVLTYITLLSKALLLHFIGVIMLPGVRMGFKMIQDDSSNHCIANFSGPQSGRLPDTCRGQVLYLAGGGRGSDKGNVPRKHTQAQTATKMGLSISVSPVLEVQFLVL